MNQSVSVNKGSFKNGAVSPIKDLAREDNYSAPSGYSVKGARLGEVVEQTVYSTDNSVNTPQNTYFNRSGKTTIKRF